MVDQIPDHAAAILNSASLVDLERLARGIDRKQITELVKHNKYLQKHVFPGFRSTNLPWERVPVKLAQDAHQRPTDRIGLFRAWLETNSGLCERVEKAIGIETIEDDVAYLLTSMGHDGGDRLLWALLLDRREEIRSALTNGLRDALTSETSALKVRVDRDRLASQLERAEQEIKALKERLIKLEERDRLLNRRIERFDDLQDELQLLKKAKKNDEERSLNDIRQIEATLQRANEESGTAQERVRELQAALHQEQAHTTELQKRLDNLRGSLEAAITSRDENTSDIERRLDETLKLLEDQRRENTFIQQMLNRAETDKVIAYEKRDEERDLRGRAESRLEKLEIDKNVLIRQRREDHKNVEQLKDELRQVRTALPAKGEAREPLSVLLDVDEAWDEAIEILADHLALLLPGQESANPSVPRSEKVSDWQAWQQTESTYVQPLLATTTPISIEDLVNVVRVQKLLALRWYLLECLKLNLTGALDANNRVKNGLK